MRVMPFYSAGGIAISQDPHQKQLHTSLQMQMSLDKGLYMLVQV